MGCEKYSLLLETIKFLELCQSYLSKGRIQLKDYYTMTELKFIFLDKVLQEDEKLMARNEYLETQAYKVLTNHKCISRPS